MKRGKRRGVCALLICLFAVVCFPADISWSAGSAGIPLPGYKPDFEIVETPAVDFDGANQTIETVVKPGIKPQNLKASDSASLSSKASGQDSSRIVKPDEKPKRKSMKYVLADFTKSLLNFGGPPVPARKPAALADRSGALSKSDVALYKEIFALQDAGDIVAARAKMAALSNLRLRGYVLYQRYMHPTAYKSSFEELHNWMSAYGDYPGADKIYALAVRKKPDDFKGEIAKPKISRGAARINDPVMYAGRVYRSENSRSVEQRKTAQSYKKGILSLIKKGEFDAARQALQDTSKGGLDVVESDQLRARLASGYLYAGHVETAGDIARSAALRSGVQVPLSGWVAGLVSWSKADYKNAAKFFEVSASSPYASGWVSAAAAYWSARAHMRRGNVKAVSSALNKAASHPRTFYGLIATRALGRDFEFSWDLPEFTDNDRDVLAQIPAGVRAQDLAAVGQSHLAEAELLRIDPRDNQPLRDALLSYAGHAHFPALALRLGSYSSGEGRRYDTALYPKGAWVPQSSYKIDPALVHAIMRQESRFDPMAQSYSGAVGLMQLMPRTAHYVAKTEHVRLTHPKTNLEIGQTYLNNLLSDRNVNRDLLSLLIAYNAGPGNLSRWRRQWADIDDPLLFIELIPSSETRIYVERVLSNYWIYRLREGLDTPTLEALAEGRKAEYAATHFRGAGATQLARN